MVAALQVGFVQGLLGSVVAAGSALIAISSVTTVFRRRRAEERFLTVLTDSMRKTFTQDKKVLEHAKEGELPEKEKEALRGILLEAVPKLKKTTDKDLIERALKQPSPRGRESYERKILSQAARQALLELETTNAAGRVGRTAGESYSGEAQPPGEPEAQDAGSQEVTGQVTNQVGQVAQEVRGTAEEVAEQAQEAAGEGKRGDTAERTRPTEDLRNAALEAEDLTGGKLEGGKRPNLRRAYLVGADLLVADFRKANLQGGHLREANLQGAYLQGANLRDADLQGVNLRGANVQGANLQRADLREADLQGDFLREADLRVVDFRKANLQGADLQGANLQVTDLEETTGLIQEDIEHAIGNERTKLPEGLRRPDAWSKRIEVQRAIIANRLE